jgi:predicted phage terminase large subunit-like protein
MKTMKKNLLKTDDARKVRYDLKKVIESVGNRRQGNELLATALQELHLRKERKLQQGSNGLLHFVRYFWDVLEPNREFIDGWPIEAMCDHLTAVSCGLINRILINVPPGSMKSLLCNVFWPAWEWSAFGQPGTRYISFSYSSLLTERDNQRMIDLIESKKFQALWGEGFRLRQKGMTKVSNDKHGWKFASSVRGTGTGERGDRVILDDPHNIKEGESQTIREETVRWFREAMSNRLNHMTKSAIVVIMQRVHEDDVSGAILAEELGYEHLMIPLLYESDRHCVTSIGWEDPREIDGENYWPERMPPSAVNEAKKMGDFAFVAQYQQRPAPRGGGIFKDSWWNIWDPEDGRYPPFDFIIASCDPAYTDRDENDPCGFVILGVNYAHDGTPRVFLIAAWRKWLLLHGPDLQQEWGEPDEAFAIRQKETWGVVEWIGHSCKRFKVDRLLIESKASGLSIAQEMERLLFDRHFSIELVNPGRSDKSVRANRVQHIFAAGMVYRPDRNWAEMVQSEMAAFPKSRYDDLLDAMTQGLWWLRQHRMLETKAEIMAANSVPAGIPRDDKPLYPM